MSIKAEKIIDILPKILKEKPELRYQIVDILSAHFPLREETNALLREIKELREEMNRRFESMQKEMDRRFESMQKEMDRRFEAIDRRFEAMDRRFEAMDRRFEAMDRRFEAMDRRFDTMDRKIDVLSNKVEDYKDWTSIVVGGFQRRAGRSLEDTIAGTLRVALAMREIKSENIKLRQKIKDEKGLIGLKGKSYEYDILIFNDTSYIFEIKSVADVEDIERFNDKALLIKEEKGLKKMEKVFITLDKSLEITEWCKKLDIVIV